jgi:hypothetical protein
VNQTDIADFLVALGSVKPVVASQDNGDPEIAWGDIPHPVYASYGWASVINPLASAEAQVKGLLIAAHVRALQKIEG